MFGNKLLQLLLGHFLQLLPLQMYKKRFTFDFAAKWCKLCVFDRSVRLAHFSKRPYFCISKILRFSCDINSTLCIFVMLQSSCIMTRKIIHMSLMASLEIFYGAHLRLLKGIIKSHTKGSLTMRGHCFVLYVFCIDWKREILLLDVHDFLCQK